MRKHPDPPIALLKELLLYEPDTGLLRWKVASSPSAPAGAIAGSSTTLGYVKVKAGKELELCPDMVQAVSCDYAQLQTLRDTMTGKRRQRVALVKRRASFPLLFCPWCRTNIDTTPVLEA